MSSLGFYLRVVLLLLVRPLSAFIGLFSSRARSGFEVVSLRCANHMFRPPTGVMRIQGDDACKDTSDFFTLCRRLGLQDDWFVGKQFLYVGCGEGAVGFAVHERGASTVTGIDIDADRIATARRIAKSRKIDGVNFEAVSVYELKPSDDVYDAAFSFNVFEHIPDVPSALESIHRVLKPGAELMFNVDAFRSRYGAHLGAFIGVPWPYVFFSEYALKNVWLARYERFQREQPEGQYRMPPAAEGFLSLNRHRLKEIDAFVSESPFELQSEAYYAEEPLLRMFPFLARIGSVCEYMHKKVYLLRKT